MGDKTGISWTDATWNPITGCSRVSEGCRNCYAERFAHRFSGKGQRYEGLTHITNGHPAWTGVIQFSEKALLKPLSWKAPRRIFVNSMSDLFHENVSDEQRDRIFAVMTLCPQHTFQVLTKRPERMVKYLKLHTTRVLIYMAAVDIAAGRKMERPQPVELPLRNVWLGTSVENQRAADDRLDYVSELGCMGWTTMVSFEPLLGEVDPGPWWLSLGKRTWAIVGGESGPGARPMYPEWARSLRDECKAAGIPFFFKQWGAWWPSEQGNYACPEVLRQLAHDEPFEDFAFVGARKAGDLLDGVQHHEYPGVSA